jgi:hypothetical protein
MVSERASEESNNISLISCLDTRGEKVLSYHLVPALGQQSWRDRTLRENDPRLAWGIKIKRLSEAYEILRYDRASNFL